MVTLGVGGVEDWVKNVKELRSRNWDLQIVTGIKYSIGNIVDNIVVTVYGARWALDTLGEQFVKYLTV